MTAERRTKVGQLVLSLEMGGLERLVVDFLRSLGGADFDIALACLGRAGALAGEVERMGVSVTSLGWDGGLSPRLAARVARWIRRERIELLHTHNSAPHFYGALGAWMSGLRRIVHTKHGRDWPDERRKVALNRISSLLSTRVVTVSMDAYRIARDIERVPENKLTVIYNGIDTERYSPPARRSDSPIPAAAPRGAPVIGAVARLSPEKDHRTLLEAFALAARKNDRAVLVLAGDGPSRGELEERASRLPCKGRIFFLGEVEDVAGLLGSFSVFALTSRTEGISLALLEAGACGVPAVATDVGGNGEVIADGETGFLVPPGDPARTAERLVVLLDDDELRRRMGENARKRVVENFSLEKMTARYRELYDEILRRR